MRVIHDRRLPDEYKEALSARLPDAELYPFDGIEDGSTEPVYASISCHPDIYYFEFDKKTLIHAPALAEEHIKNIKTPALTLIKGKRDPHGSYPDTVRYNAVRIGNMMFHNTQYTDQAIIDTTRKKGLKLVNVAQGYSRCSVLVVDDNSIVTSDKGIADVAASHGIDVLFVTPSSIVLPDEDHGFIGGTSGKLPDGTVIFLGDMDLHREGSGIKDFLAKRSVKYIDLPGLLLYDAGVLIILD